MTKPAPLLIDRFLATRDPGLLTRRTYDNLQARVRASKVFVMDEAAALRVAETCREVPDLLARQQQFARQPYDVMWVEFELRALWEAITGRVMDDRGDYKIAYFYDHGTASVVVGGTQEDPGATPCAMPLVYDIGTPWELADQIAFVERVKTSRMNLDMFFWGEAVMKLLDREEQRDLRAHNTLRMIARPDLDPEALFHTIYQNGAGELRNMLAILLLMNRPSLTRFVRDVPRRRGFVRGKLRPFMGHSVVTIDLSPVPTLRRLGTPADDGTPRRRHEVRGHYCHNDAYRQGTRLGCEHAFVRDEAATHPEDSWLCTGCGGKRWWRSMHHRGDAGTGFVQKVAYEITA